MNKLAGSRGARSEYCSHNSACCTFWVATGTPFSNRDADMIIRVPFMGTEHIFVG